MDVPGLTFGLKALIGSGGYSPEDVCDVMDIMKSGRWDIERIITREFPWEQLPEAIETARIPSNAPNVVIHF